jgi:tetratricopeptide (TPR) repeat protein
MNETVAKIAQKFINWEAIILVFLLPLFFLPITTEYFEFNKIALLAVAVTLGLIAWGIKAVASGKIGFRRSRFDIPVFLFWLVTLVATIFSEHLVSSVTGHYGRWYPSLVTVTLLTVLYFLITSNIERETPRRVGYALLTSGMAGALLFIPQYFGRNLFDQDWSQWRSFTPLGSPVTLAVFLGLIAPLALRETIIRAKHIAKAAFSVASLTMIGTLILLRVPAGWAAFAGSTITTLFLIKGPDLKLKRSWIYPAVVLIAGFAFGVFAYFNPTLKEHASAFGEELRTINLDLRTSWSVSATSFRQRPFWGSGPSTFLFDFTRYKPLRFNYTSYWSLRFDKPISEYLLAFAEMGLLGVLAYLLLVVAFIRQAKKSDNKWLAPLVAGVFLSFFLSSASLAIGFLLILILAVMGAIEHHNTGALDNQNAGSSDSRRGYAVLGVTLTLAVILGYGIWRYYPAEVYLRSAFNSFSNGDYQTAYNQHVEAINRFPQRDYYHSSLASVCFTWANDLAASPTAGEEETASDIQLLVSQAIQEGKQATELSPLNVGNWESLAQTYRNLIGFAEGAEDWAVNSYRNAINLDLFNPVIRLNLGGLFYQQGDLANAIEQFQAAVNLKSNYANAHYNLGVAYGEAGETDLAISEIEAALRLAPAGTPGYEEAQAFLDELKSQQNQ